MPAINLTTFTLPSHCIVTVGVGTTYAPTLHRTDVHTRLSLRFEGAYPLTVGLLEAAREVRGFELTLTGNDELDQLIRALETAATELRIQAGRLGQDQLPARSLDELVAIASRQADERQNVAYHVQADEDAVLSLLLHQGGRQLPKRARPARGARAGRQTGPALHLHRP